MMKWRRAWLVRRRRKKGVAYAVRWYAEDGSMRSESVGPDRKFAEMQRKRRESEINSPDYVELRQLEPTEFIKELLELERNKVADRTLVEIERILHKFFQVVVVKHANDLNARHADYFRTMRLKEGRSPATVNKEWRHLKAIFNKAMALKYVEANPFAGLKPIPAPEKAIRVLSREEIQALFKAAEDNIELSLLLHMLTETGARIGEVLNLEFGDIDTERGVVHIHSKGGWRTKSRKNRFVYVSPQTCEMVRSYQLQRSFEATTAFTFVFTMRDCRWPARKAYDSFKRLAKKACIEKCSPHDLRKTVISQLAQNGVNQAVAQQLAGHHSLATTTTYYTRIGSEAVRKAVESLPWWGARSE